MVRLQYLPFKPLQAQQKRHQIMIENGTKVKIHYTGTLNDGTEFDSSRERDPLEFEIGAGMVIPGFDAAVKAMEVGEVKKVNIPSAEAYGEARAEMIGEVPKAHMPEGMEVQVGMMLSMQAPDGQQIPVRVTEIGEESVTVDANHPLAGQDLNFELELVSAG